MNRRPLVFLDIETTGGSPAYSKITEIGALRVENMKVVAEYRQLINPEQPVPFFITRMTGITNEMLWDQPIFRGIADDLELFLSDALFIAHNVGFDYSFIKAEYSNIGYRFAMDRLCTARLSRRLFPEHRRHNLDSIIDRHKIKVKNRHRAFDDAEVLWKFYRALLRQKGHALHASMQSLITAC